MKDFFALLKSKGYFPRKHIEEEGWGLFKNTVVDLDGSERTLDFPALRERLKKNGEWLFPPGETERPAPLDMAIRLGRAQAVVPAGVSHPMRRLAERWREELLRRHGISVAFVSDTEAVPGQPLIVFGGAHENAFTRRMAVRCLFGVADASVPGNDGWLASTVCTLAGETALFVTGAENRWEELLSYLFAQTSRDGAGVSIAACHRIEFGNGIPEALQWNEPSAAEVFRGMEPFAEDGSTHANNVPILKAVLAAQCYLLGADARALKFFRDAMRCLLDYYLKRPGGAAYPADCDFFYGPLLLLFARLEHHFPDDERWLARELFVGCLRSVFEYNVKIWPAPEEELTRHNHQTYAGISLLIGAEYFRHLDEAKIWKSRADAIFSARELFRRSKHRENAMLYEVFVPLHAAAYSALRGGNFDLFDKAALSVVAHRLMSCVDNFFHGVDYGDASLTIYGDPIVRLNAIGVKTFSCAAAEALDNPQLRWLAWNIFQKESCYLDNYAFFGGLNRNDELQEPESGQWEFHPLDPAFRRDFAPGVEAGQGLDKAVFRTGWRDADQYLCFEGVGNNGFSHGHAELNTVVRYNHCGRHWIVSNGYGCSSEIKDITERFVRRSLGPDGHNMLVIRRAGEIVRTLPPAAALLEIGNGRGCPYLTGLLKDYAGVDWFRSIVIIPGAGFLALDRMDIREGDIESAHMEWNCLGRAEETPDGWQLEQNGAFLHVSSPSPLGRRTGETHSEDWREIISARAYPHAGYPLSKLLFDIPSAPGQQRAAVWFEASTGCRPGYRLTQEAGERYCLSGPGLPDENLETDYFRLTLRNSRT